MKAVYRECLWKVNTKDKILYLTFDDGPIPNITAFVLDELRKWNAKATFFCIGRNVENNPEIFQKIVDEEHSIGNHTYDHLKGWNCKDREYLENIEKCGTVLNSKLLRPPYGKLKPSQYLALKSQYKLVMWDVLSFDFDTKISQEKVLSNVIKNAEEGSIVVFHDSLKAEAKVRFVLPKVLEHFSAKGFKFEKL
ncbi:MAG: polysaccharide deacetylase family protein [Bacteroidota bacterium]